VPSKCSRYNPPFNLSSVEFVMFREEVETLENLGEKLVELRRSL
jgi:hypothetical protein